MKALAGLITLLGLIAVSPLRALAQVIDTPYQPTRAMALGSTAIPLADDAASGLFVQPAALARADRFSMEPLNVQLYGSDGYFKTMNSKSLSGFSFSPSSVKSQAYQDSVRALARRYPGKIIGSGGSFTPNMSFGLFSFGVLVQARSSAVSNSNGDVTFRNRYQLIPALGFGLPLAHGILKFGYTIQWLNESEEKQTVAASTATANYGIGLKEGQAFSHNVGLTLQLPYKNLPAFHIVSRAIGGVTFNKSKMVSSGASSLMDKRPMTVDVGVGWVDKLGKGSGINWVLQYRDVTNRSGTSAGIRATGGLELSIKDAFFLRGGFGNGYPSGGIGFKVKRSSSLDLAWYTQELSNGFRETGETRFVMQYQLRLF